MSILCDCKHKEPILIILINYLVVISDALREDCGLPL